VPSVLYFIELRQTRLGVGVIRFNDIFMVMHITHLYLAIHCDKLHFVRLFASFDKYGLVSHIQIVTGRGITNSL